MDNFKKDDQGNWYNVHTGYFLGTDEGFYEHLMEAHGFTVRQVIDNLMGIVNESFKEN